MDISCPNCAATYRVPDALLAPGKALRCAACGEPWVPERPPAPEVIAPPPLDAEPAPEAAMPEPAAPELPAPALPEAEPAAPQPLPARPASPLTPPPLNPRPLQGRGERSGASRRRSGAWLRLAWVASIATVLLALAGLVFFGDAIAAAWPPFARVTSLLGG